MFVATGRMFVEGPKGVKWDIFWVGTMEFHALRPGFIGQKTIENGIKT